MQKLFGKVVKENSKANYDNLGKGWIFLIAFMRACPDFVQDLTRSDDADYDLTLIQRVILRVKARNQYVDVTGCRGLTKSYCSIIEELDEGLLYPGIKTAYFGPSFKQTSKIGSSTFKQIAKDYPSFARHYHIAADSSDKFELDTMFGTNFSISAFRGNNTHKVVAEETAQENLPRFDEEEYRSVVLPAIRLRYLVKGRRSPAYIAFKQHQITSAGRRQNHSYETRCRHLQMMERGESAFVMDVPFDVSLLCQMRPVAWAETLRNELTPDEWAREMESRYSGSDQNPMIPDNTLSESRSLMVMEEHHCCKDYDNRTDANDVFYVIGYDVSYADGAVNAKCACTVVKCTLQKEWQKRNHYLKQVVWVNDWPAKPAMEQAIRLKQIWYRYCYEGHRAFLAIDAWQYGSSVIECLMQDLGDGLNSLCTINHTMYQEMELVDAIPVIYPIKAGGIGTTDPDADMIRNAEVQFDNHNVQMLISNYGAGIEAYKKLHRIKDDRSDYVIYVPYKKTNELVGQIQNLKKVTNTNGVAEKRISSMIQRDSWSALKYALRLAQVLERQNLMRQRRESDWDSILKQYENGNGQLKSYPTVHSRMVVKRSGKRQI